MSERGRWVADRWAEWSDDDPAIARMREALRRSEPVQEAAGRAEAPEAESVHTPVPVRPDRESTRRDRIAALIQRTREGDFSAVETLRRLIDGT